MNKYAITGTFNGSIVYADTEGDARRLFHKRYNGESILIVKLIPIGCLDDYTWFITDDGNPINNFYNQYKKTK